MTILIGILTFIFGLIFGFGMYAVVSYKQLKKLGDENAELKRKLNMSNKCRQIID